MSFYVKYTPTDQPQHLERNNEPVELTHPSLCFSPCAGWASSHCGEANIVVGSILGRCVRHGSVAGAGLWLRSRTLSLRLPPSTTSTSLPRGESASCVGLPGSCVLGRWRRPRWGAHWRKGRGCSSRGGGLAREARASWSKGQRLWHAR